MLVTPACGGRGIAGDCDGVLAGLRGGSATMLGPDSLANFLQNAAAEASAHCVTTTPSCNVVMRA